MTTTDNRLTEEQQRLDRVKRDFGIYQLSSSRDPLLARYIGKTSQTFEARLRGHKWHYNGTLVSQWIAKEMEEGYKIIVQGLVIGLTGQAAEAFERELIQSMPKNLLNVEWHPTNKDGAHDPAREKIEQDNRLAKTIAKCDELIVDLQTLANQLRVSMTVDQAAWAPWLNRDVEEIVD